MANSKLKMEIEKLKNNANVDDGLKQVVLELQNEVVEFESRIKKIIEKANNKLTLSYPNKNSNNDVKQLPISVNNFQDIEEDDLWIPKELLNDEVKIPEIDKSNNNSNIDFMSLINKSTPGKSIASEIDILEKIDEKIDYKQNIEKSEYKINDHNDANFNNKKSIKISSNNNINFTISQIKNDQNIQKINLAIEKNNENSEHIPKIKHLPLKTQIIRNIERTNDIDSQYKGILSRNNLNKDPKEFSYILKRREIDDFGKKRRMLSKTRMIKLNSTTNESNRDNNGSFTKTIRISFSKNK